MYRNVLSAALLGLAAAVFASGCGQGPGGAKDKGADKGSAENGDHPTEGPHKGVLIELGEEEYHGELVHDDKAHKVTVYILDGEAKKNVPVDAAKEVVINIKHGKRPETFKLEPSPMDDDPEGKSSRFVSEDEHLSEDLDAADIEARLVVEIAGKSYTGDVPAGEGEHGHKHDKE